MVEDIDLKYQWLRTCYVSNLSYANEIARCVFENSRGDKTVSIFKEDILRVSVEFDPQRKYEVEKT